MEGGFIPELEPEGFNQIQPKKQDHSNLGYVPARGNLAGTEQHAGDAPRGCSKCNSLSYSDEFYKSFGVAVCNSCRKQEKLISKSTAKQKYQLTDGDMKPLGSVKRSNPHRKDWQPMRLYLESQVVEVAMLKHGSFEGIEARARAVLDAKLQARLKKREEEKDKEAKDVERLKRIRSKIEEENAVAGEAVVSAEETEEI